ncbi:MAG: tetratricopeptide repeat protein, partial [Gammaproteobacteria bacterium]|nr:tetratricopeptide repeat protein [Gammaproteobacteria bacterium]
ACTSEPFSVPALPGGERPASAQQQLQELRLQAVNNEADADALGIYAMALHAYGLNEQAAALYAEARRLAPEQFGWHYLHGLVLNALGDDSSAVEALAAAASIDGRAGPALAGTLIGRGDFDDAEWVLNQSLAANDRNPRITYELGRIALERGELELAERHLKTSLQLGGVHRSIFARLAEVNRRLGDNDETAIFLKQLEEAKDHLIWPDPYIARVLALHAARSDRFFLKLATDAIESGEIETAIRYTERAHELNSSNVVAVAALIGLYAAAGNHDKSNQMIELASKLDSDSAVVHYNIGLARIAQNNLEAAEASLLKVTRQDRQGSAAWIRLADIYTQQGRRQDTADALEQAFDKAPADEQLRLKLGTLYVQIERFDEGLEVLARPMSSESHEARRLWATGRAQLATDAADAGLTDLRRAVALADTLGETRLAATIRQELAGHDAR